MVDHRATSGATLELQQHLKINANHVPLALLRSPVEKRSVTAFPAAAEAVASFRPIVPPVFALGDAAFLGVDMPTVPVGDAVFPVLTTRPTIGGPHKDSSEVDETTGVFTVDALEPSRLQASFFYRRSDAARFAGMGEALRSALEGGLSEAMDKEVVDQIVTDVARTDAGAADTFASYRKRMVFDRIDGRFANVEGDVRLLVGASTLADMSGLYRGELSG